MLCCHPYWACTVAGIPTVLSSMMLLASPLVPVFIFLDGLPAFLISLFFVSAPALAGAPTVACCYSYCACTVAGIPILCCRPSLMLLSLTDVVVPHWCCCPSLMLLASPLTVCWRFFLLVCLLFLASLFYVSSSALAGVPVLLTVRPVYLFKLFLTVICCWSHLYI
jgi:hypothetical protein